MTARHGRKYKNIMFEGLNSVVQFTKKEKKKNEYLWPFMPYPPQNQPVKGTSRSPSSPTAFTAETPMPSL